MYGYNTDDTIVALSTPPGEGAIGVIRLSGKDAIRLVKTIFDGKDLGGMHGYEMCYGRIVDKERNIVDEVVVGLFRAPRSYTGEDVLEISCHGSPYIIRRILELCVDSGMRLAEPGEFTMRAFINGKMDLSQAEAVADLIAADSETAHRVAMQQMRGGVRAEIADLRQELLDFASLIELELDFGEEDVEFADRTKLNALVTKIKELLEALVESFVLGNAIKLGVNTVIAGRPNAGKSTLLNVLLNEDRAIVSAVAGTTRDTIEEVLNIKGVSFRLIDTAGIRDAVDQIESVGVQKTFEKIAQSAILLYVFDVIAMGPEEVAKDIAQLYRPGMHILAIANKMDLNPYTPPEVYATDLLPLNQIITTSAKNGMNIPYLKERLYEAVISQDLQDQTIISNTRHLQALRKALDRMNAVEEGLRTGIPSDLVAMDIRQALHHLGEITGEVTTDDLLGNIFGKFCIGK